MEKTERNSTKGKASIVITLLILAGLVLANFIIQIGVEPGYINMGTDSGTFAYCGQVIHDGGVMYRDCWDNKPPGVYYLNAAAISLGGSNPFAIWLFQAIWLSVAVGAFFLILKHIWQNIWLAVIGAITLLGFILYPVIFQGGNYTETYAILPIVLSIGSLWVYLGSGQKRWLVALGVLAAAGFLFKPTYITIGLAAGAVVAFIELRRRAFKELGINLGVLLLSALLPLVLVAMYWVMQHDFYELWFAVFMHNFTYVEEGFSIKSLYTTARTFLIQQPMVGLTILFASSAGVFLFQHSKVIFSAKRPSPDVIEGFIPGRMDRQYHLMWFMLVIFLSSVLDVAFYASSGRNFGHYLQVLIPSMVVVMVYLIDNIYHSIQNDHLSHTMQAAILSALLIVGLGCGMEIIAKEIPSSQALKTFVMDHNRYQYIPNELEQYIIDHSTAQDSILVWSGHPGINFVTQRRAPTRYIFLLHLFTPTPDGPNGFKEFMRDLNADPPALIVVQPDNAMGLPDFELPAETICPKCDPSTLEGVLAFKQYVSSNYELKFSIWDWKVYQRIN